MSAFLLLLLLLGPLAVAHAADTDQNLRGTRRDLEGDLNDSPLYHIPTNLGQRPLIHHDSSEQQRIVGGRPANVTTDSYFVMTLTSSGFFRGCGASLISNCHAICAAHCGQISRVFVGAYAYESGSSRPSRNTGPYFDTDVSQSIINPDHNDKTNEGDLSILVFEKCMTQAEMRLLPPALIPDRNFQYQDGENTDVLGFGRTSENDSKNSAGQYVQVLQKVTVPFFPYLACKPYFGGSLKPDMVCAGEVAGGKDACIGDSGGPAAVWRNGLPYVVGVTSWGIGCARKNYLGVYASTLFYHDWIENIVCVQDSRTITSQLELCGGSRAASQPAPTLNPTPPPTRNPTQPPTRAPVAPTTPAPVAPTQAPTPAPTSPPTPAPTGKCFLACPATEGKEWVCKRDDGCEGCDPDLVCPLLCSRCSGVPPFDLYGGLSCNC